MSDTFKFLLKKTSFSDMMILELHDDIDGSNLPELKEIFLKCSQDKSTKYLIIDLTYLKYLNSEVIKFFLVEHNKCIQDSKEFCFTCANDEVFDIIDLIGLTKVVSYFPTVDQAINHFEKK